MSGELVRRDEVSDVLARLSDADVDPRERGRLLLQLARLIGVGAKAAGARAAVSGKWLTEAVAATAAVERAADAISASARSSPDRPP